MRVLETSLAQVPVLLRHSGRQRLEWQSVPMDGVMTDMPMPALAANASVDSRIASAAETIRALARRHGIAYQPTPLDAFAADVSRLSDAEVAPDAVEDLLQVLTRAGMITHAQRFALHAAYLRERPQIAAAE